MKLLEIKEELITKGALLGMPALFFCFGEKEGGGFEMSVEELLKTAEKSVMRYMVLTGELSSQKEDLTILADGIKNLFRRVVVESDGAEYIDLEADLFSLDLNSRVSQGRRSWPAETIERYLSGGKELELRIYVEDEIDLRETLIALSNHVIPRKNIFLVPTGATFGEYLENLSFLSKECLKYSFRLGERLDHTLAKAEEEAE